MGDPRMPHSPENIWSLRASEPPSASGSGWLQEAMNLPENYTETVTAAACNQFGVLGIERTH
jgi:hypothetical protein